MQTIHPHTQQLRRCQDIWYGALLRGRRIPTLKSSSLEEGDLGDISLRDDFPAPKPVHAQHCMSSGFQGLAKGGSCMR